MNPNQPTPPTPPTPMPMPTPTPVPTMPDLSGTNPPVQNTPIVPTPPENKSSKLPVIILLVALGILILAGGGYYLYMKMNAVSPVTNNTSDRTVTQTPTPSPSPTPTIQQDLNSVATDSAVDKQIGTVDQDLPKL